MEVNTIDREDIISRISVLIKQLHIQVKRMPNSKRRYFMFETLNAFTNKVNGITEEDWSLLNSDTRLPKVNEMVKCVMASGVNRIGYLRIPSHNIRSSEWTTYDENGLANGNDVVINWRSLNTKRNLITPQIKAPIR